MSGFVFINRKIASNGLWQDKPFARGQAWIDLIMLASWKDSSFFKRGVKITQPKGTVAISMKGLSDRWGWSRGKVLRFLEYLKTERQIDTKIDNVTTLIYIKNYDKYQTNGHQNGHQTDTIEEVKEVILYLNEVCGKKFKPTTAKNVENINARLKEGFTVEQCKHVIDVKFAEWQGTEWEKYLCPETLFRPSKFEKYLNQTATTKNQFTDSSRY